MGLRGPNALCSQGTPSLSSAQWYHGARSTWTIGGPSHLSNAFLRKETASRPDLPWDAHVYRISQLSMSMAAHRNIHSPRILILVSSTAMARLELVSTEGWLLSRLLVNTRCPYQESFVSKVFYGNSASQAERRELDDVQEPASSSKKREAHKMSIMSLLEQIREDKIVLPAIQRDFVWSEQKMQKLMDSIMRGYPIGIVLLWETYNDMQYRSFVQDYDPGMLHVFKDNEGHRRLRLVLDGQQRLQSFYTAIYGTYEGRRLYFDTLSGLEMKDFRENKYVFDFFMARDARQKNRETHEAHTKHSEKSELHHYHCVGELVLMGAREKLQFQRRISKQFGLSEDDESRLALNLDLLHRALTSDTNIMKKTVIDENKPRDSAERLSESEVLEAFFRINTEGTTLNRSDLIFSMLKLSWKESAVTLPEFVLGINEGNSFELDTDFVIRCLFAVSHLGTKFDVNVLRKEANIRKIKKNFDPCCDAIRSTVDFVYNKCWIASSKLLGGDANLVPLVYYLFHTRNHLVPNNQVDNVRKAVYLFGFKTPFSRYAGSRLWRFVHDELKPRAEKSDETFPLEDALWWVWYWEDFEDYGPELLQGNPSLALHLIQGRTGAKAHYEKNAPQVDHIFPRSVLREMDRNYREDEIHHFANLWILAKNKNQNKGKMHPKKYFSDVSPADLRRAYINKDLLHYGRYRTFLKERQKKILNHVKRELKLKKHDYDVAFHHEIE